MLDYPYPQPSRPSSEDTKMEFDEQEEPELAMPGAIYDNSALNPCRVKMLNHIAEEPVMMTQPATRNSGKGRYKECLKNHAVGIGGHALDGCCEFMAAGAEGTLDALKCAACNCHRNFHRKEADASAVAIAGDPFLLPFHQRRHHQPPHFAAYYRAPAGYLHVRGGATLALPSTSGAGGGPQSPREDQDDGSDPGGGGGSKKRFRTKFTQEQKDKMLGFAERLGWRIQKQDESIVQEFCAETGIKRHVLKVWMHNNKHTLGKKP